MCDTLYTRTGLYIRCATPHTLLDWYAHRAPARHTDLVPPAAIYTSSSAIVRYDCCTSCGAVDQTRCISLRIVCPPTAVRCCRALVAPLLRSAIRMRAATLRGQQLHVDLPLQSHSQRRTRPLLMTRADSYKSMRPAPPTLLPISIPPLLRCCQWLSRVTHSILSQMTHFSASSVQLCRSQHGNFSGCWQ